MPTAAHSALTLRALRAVAAVHGQGSAAGAAVRLHLSVSAVTRAVRQAEDALGLPLFDRGARGMATTPAGRVLAARVQRAIAELSQGQGALAPFAPAGEARLALRVTEGMLLALAAVAETRSETAAGAELGISQAAVHQTLSRLEHLARTRLFERSPRGTRLSEAGELLLRRAKLALTELRIAQDELASLRGLAAGRVALGALPMAADVLVPQALARLFAQQPGIIATVADGTYAALLQQLRHGDVDLLVGPLRADQAAHDIEEQLLFVDRLMPVVRAGHPLLASARPPTSLRALQSLPWIGPLPGTPARAAFERAFAAARLPLPHVGLQANSPAVVRSVLLAGDHVAMLSALQIRAEVDSGLLVLLPVPVQGTQRPIGLTLRRDGLASPACRALMGELRAVAAEVTDTP